MRSKFKWIFTLLVALTMQFSFAQEKTVTGVISDELGPIAGANVVVKGTARGTTTDFDGNYVISAKQGDVLEISYVGYANQEVTVGTANSYNVTIKATQLEEVVVTGALGIQRKADEVTSAFKVVSAEEMSVAANPDAVRSLAAKVAGLQINNSSNGLDGTTSIKIRAPKSFTNSGEALIVIDGIPSNSKTFSALSPAVIESVNVLRGAQGAALYGEQGVNGVIVVTTKKGGKKDKVAVSFTSAVDFEDILFTPEKQSKYGQGWDGVWYAAENGGWGELYDGSIRDVGLQQADGSYVQAPYSFVDDAMEQYYQTGTIFNNSIDLKLSGDKSYANFNAANLTREFIVDGDESRRNNFMFKGGVMGDKWSMDAIFNYINTKSDFSDAENTLQHLQQSAGNVPIGMFNNNDPIGGWTAYYANPFWERNNKRVINNTDYFSTNLSLSYKVNKNIKLLYNGGMRFQVDNQMRYNNGNKLTTSEIVVEYLGDLTETSTFYQSVFRDRNYYGDIMAQFEYQLTEDLGLKAILGHNTRMRDYSRISQGGAGLEISGWYNISNVLSPDVVSQLSNYTSQSRSTAEFASVDLDYKNYLFLNLTGRYDHVSRLSINNRDFFYPSAGLSFVPTNMPNFKVDKIDYLKVFANYTRVGSTDAINDYEIINYGQLASGFPYSGTGNSFNDRYFTVDPNIKPEMYSTYELGFNIEMFKNRVRLDAAVYKTDINDAIFGVTSSTVAGILSTKQNVGDLENKGLDLTLGLTPIKTSSFKWDTNINFTTYTNKVKSLAGGQDAATLYNLSDVPTSSIGGSIVGIVGEDFPYLLGTGFATDDQGRVIVDATTGLPSIDNTQQKIGKVNPDYIVGLTNSFEYKGFSLNLTADYRKGGKLFSETIYNLTWPGHLEETASYDREVGFIYPNSVVQTSPGVYTENTTVYTGAGHVASRQFWGVASQTGKQNVIDATAFKIREISLGYTLPKAYTDKLGLTSLRFNLNARNPFVDLASNNKGYADPESNNVYNSSTANASRRLTTAANASGAATGFAQVGQYPTTRTFGFSVNVGF